MIEEKLKELGIDLDDVPSPGGSYASVNIRNNTAFVSIQFPIERDSFRFTGVLGHDLKTIDGKEAARLCAVNILRQLNKYVGFEKLDGLNHLDIYYQAAENWDDGPIVADGASELFNKILGEQGKHSRAIMAVHKLPRNFSVGVVSSFSLT